MTGPVTSGPLFRYMLLQGTTAAGNNVEAATTIQENRGVIEVRPIRMCSSRSTTSSRQRLPGLLWCLMLLPLLALTACDKAADRPVGASDVVVRVEASGGFVPVEYNLTHTPEFTLYGDGTVIVTGPMIEIWPQPALPNLQRATATQKDIAKLLTLAEEAGLMANGVDYGQPNVTDLPTTVITVNAGGKTYVSNIYALGFGETFDEGSADMAPETGLTLEQIEARAAVLSFVAKTVDLDTFTGSTLQWEQYDFASLAIFSVAYDPAGPTYDETVPPNHLDWPLGDLSTLGESVSPEGYRRAVVAGEDLDKLTPLLGQATQITLWKSGGHEYYLYFRPLLPDENA